MDRDSDGSGQASSMKNWFWNWFKPLRKRREVISLHLVETSEEEAQNIRRDREVEERMDHIEAELTALKRGEE
jgi:hypothetical protein